MKQLFTIMSLMAAVLTTSIAAEASGFPYNLGPYQYSGYDDCYNNRYGYFYYHHVNLFNCNGKEHKSDRDACQVAAALYGHGWADTTCSWGLYY